MKKLFWLFATIVLLWSCDNDNTEFEIINVATPEVMSKMEFRNSVEVLPPQTIDESGKIYAYGNYIFVNDEFQGVHIIDNTNPETPNNIAFLKIPGNIDISIKNNFLFADSSTDLVVFDISVVNDIQQINRLEDVFSIYDYQIPLDVDEVNWTNFDYETQVIVGWTVTQEQREVVEDQDDIFLETGGGDLANNAGDVGTGGSLARFQIVGDYLYTVGSYEMDIFNISDLSQPILSDSMYAGWNIETMFQADGYLYLGGTNGMYIYSLDNPAYPQYMSEFVHWEGCDPVVVDGDIAYLTLRGGNACGQQESILEVIDVSDKLYPQLIASYSMDNPYGLGFKNNLLFVCDGASGLKIFNKSDPSDLQLIMEYTDIFTKDVIPLDNVLLMIGDDILYQYEYLEEGINLISTMPL